MNRLGQSFWDGCTTRWKTRLCLAPYVWVVMIAFVALVCKRRGRLASPWMLLVGIWLTSMASPVFAEFRYMYGVVACMPLCVGIALTARCMEK